MRYARWPPSKSNVQQYVPQPTLLTTISFVLSVNSFLSCSRYRNCSFVGCNGFLLDTRLNIGAITAAVGKVRKVWRGKFYRLFNNFYRNVAREVCKVLIRARIYTWAIKRFKLAVRNTRQVNAFFRASSHRIYSIFSTKFHELLPPFISLSFFPSSPDVRFRKFLISTSNSEVMILPHVYIVRRKFAKDERQRVFCLFIFFSTDRECTACLAWIVFFF